MKQKSTIPDIMFNSQDASNVGFELIALESLYERSSTFDHDIFTPHRVHFHLLIYLAKGAGSHFIDFNRYSYQEGSFIFVKKNQIHAFDTHSQPRGVMILFTQAYIDSIRISIRLPLFTTEFLLESTSPVLTVIGELKESCEVFLGELKKITGEVTHDPLLTRLLFASLMVKLHREKPMAAEAQISEGDYQRIMQFITLVETHFSTTKDTTVYADMMGITYKTLNQLCKQISQQSPKQLIDAHTILEAKRRLAIESIRVSRLAYEMGFEDVSNFIKYFKKHALMTPSQFRRNTLG